MKTEKLTAEEVLHWHGSDHDIEELAQVVAELVNGDYPLALAKKEMRDEDGDLDLI